MNPIIIAGVVYVSAKVVSTIFEELTDVEKQKQADINANVDQHNERISKIKAQEQHQEDFQKELEEELSRKIDYLKQQVSERIREEEELKKEIQESAQKVSSVLHNSNITTAIRKTSLEKLYGQLIEAKERCFGNIQYLKK